MFGLDSQNYVLICVSLTLQGLFQIFVFIPIIPEMMERL